MLTGSVNLAKRPSSAPALLLALVFILASFTAARADVTLDNGAAGTSYTGTWAVSGGANPYGTNSLYARPAATYTWAINSQPAGYYEVLMWWTATDTRASQVAVDITAASGTTRTYINQTTNGGRWNSLGMYYFNTLGSVTVTASSQTLANGTTASTCADAVMFRYISDNAPPAAFIDSIAPNPALPGDAITFSGHGVDADGSIAGYLWQSDLDGVLADTGTFSTDTLSEGAHTISLTVYDDDGTASTPATQTLTVGDVPVDIIVDNGAAGTSRTGTWSTSTGTGAYGANSLYARPVATYTWSFNSQPAGYYEVYLWWTSTTTRASQVAVDISTAGGTERVYINQTTNGGRWNSLGTYYFNTLGSVTVTASSQTLANGTTASTCADAAWFHLVDENAAPLATIDSITPNPASFSDVVSFTGHGTDPDGTIAGYSWTSSLDGALSTFPAFDISGLSEGVHTISFTVTDNNGKTSSPAVQSLTIQGPPNQAPTALIDSITPSPATSGSTVTFTGHGTDSDGTITGYLWTSSINGTIGSSASFSTSSLSQGTHTITLTVTDDDGATSAPVTRSLTVNAPVNQAPTATIDSISPNPANLGSEVTFTGHGTDADGTISGYLWSSSINGSIGNAASFSISSLSAGTHTISFTVYDNNGTPSTAATSSLTVGSVPADVIIDNGAAGTSRTGTWTTSTAPNPYGSSSLYARPTATYTWTASAIPSGNYEVFMWWTATTSRPTAAQVSIASASGTQTVSVNQQTGGGQWNSLGTYAFGTQASATITASSEVLPSGSTAATCADAVMFRFVSGLDQPPKADFSVDKTTGGVPCTVQFTDRTTGDVSTWLWDFGDGGTSTLKNPSHVYTGTGYYTVTFTVTNPYGTDTMTRTSYIEVVDSLEHIYVCDGYDGGAPIWSRIVTELQSLGAVENSGVWRLENTTKGVTFFVHEVTTPAGMEAALKEEGAHVIFNGHSNYGLGATFTRTDQQQAQVRYVDDDLIVNTSTDMLSVSLEGLIFGQAYPNLKPIYKDGTSAIMPYDFGDPRGNPPFNYYVTYKVPGDDTLYFVERPDGSLIDRFEGTGKPAWDWRNGENVPPDPNVPGERTYFITNPAPEYNHFSSVGTWNYAIAPLEAYNGYNYQFRNSGGSGANTATWTVVITTPGTYRVEASMFFDTTNATNAVYTINHAGGSTEVVADMRTAPAGVALRTLATITLGNFSFNAGAYTVTLRDGANGRIIADTMSFRNLATNSRTRVDNTKLYKSHFTGGYYGSGTILSAAGKTIPEEDLKYKRMFYSSCFSGRYFLGKFHRGPMYFTLEHTGGWDNPVPEYLRRYLLGQSDEEILAWIKQAVPIYDFYNFDLKPPSMR